MKKNRHLMYVLTLLCHLPVMGLGKFENRPAKKPNIIFILTDDQRWDALGYADNQIIQTPEMDKLASKGAYFKNAIVTTPICAASRASIITGLYERTHRYTFRENQVNEVFMEKSYPMLLKEAGYHTGFFGKLGIKYPNKDQLFDVIEDYDRDNTKIDYRGYYYKNLGEDTVHLTRYTGQKALDFLDSIPKEKPFCLSLSFSAPHAHDKASEQYFWQKENDSLHGDITIPDPLIADDQYFDQLPTRVKEGFNRKRWTWRYDTSVKYQHSIKGYYRMIKGIDLEIGKIRQKLKKKGLDRNTVIILMGDNGYFMGERQLAGKWLLYDNSIRVPLIIYDPRKKHPFVVDEMVLNIDIPATIIDYTNIIPPGSWHGQSIKPLVDGRSLTIQRDTVLIEHLWDFRHIPSSEGVRTKSWKYFRYLQDESNEELYDLITDPLEINNLANDPDYLIKLELFREKCTELISRYDVKD